MFYIHQSACISHQPTFGNIELDELKDSVDNMLFAIEPKYGGIPPGQLRRMGRAVRMGVGSGLHLLQQHKLDGILISTANGGIEDSIQFLKQIIDYDEGRLTPTHFVQSTYNAIAGLLGMITENRGYNITHVHRGLAFENAVLDTAMLLSQHSKNSYLLGGVEEISPLNHHLEFMDGGYKTEPVLNSRLYESATPGAVPGEGAAMFVVNNFSQGAVAKLCGLKMLHTTDEKVLARQIRLFLEDRQPEERPVDILISGENGDSRTLPYYLTCEQMMSDQTSIVRFKHWAGEFQTASALALWLACYLVQTQKLPRHMNKRQGTSTEIQRILIYNNYKGAQHSLMLLDKVN